MTLNKDGSITFTEEEYRKAEEWEADYEEYYGHEYNPYDDWMSEE